MDKKFDYNYTAPTQAERKEIEALRNKYLLQEKREIDSLTKLRLLDKKVQNFPTALGILFGIIGTLIFGLGLTMILQWALLLWGVVVALVGFIPLALAYPIYKKTLNKRKRQYSEEILALSNDLLQNEAR